MKGKRDKQEQGTFALWPTERGVSAVANCRKTVIPGKALRTLTRAGR